MTEILKDCPACQEMVEHGLSFEETHSSTKPGYLMLDDGEKVSFVPNPHCKEVEG